MGLFSGGGASTGGLAISAAGAATGNPLAIASTVVGVVGLISGFLGSKKASKAAKSEAAEQARLEGLTTQEQLRRLKIDERTLYGQTLAGYAGGGVMAQAPTLGGDASLLTGSAQTVLNEQEREFAFQRDITQKVGATKVSQALTRGQNVADQYRYQGYSNVASGISNILTNYNAMTT